MPELDRPPRLVPPTIAVRESFLAGEWADHLASGDPADWLHEAFDDFGAFVARRRGVRHRRGVPCTTYWYVSGEHYVGTLIVRHRLTAELAAAGGHVGYHVVPPWRRQGHATRMLAAGLRECRRLGLDRVLLTCAAGNEPSRRVILANGGAPAGCARGEDRYWITLAAGAPQGGPAVSFGGGLLEGAAAGPAVQGDGQAVQDPPPTGLDRARSPPSPDDDRLNTVIVDEGLVLALAGFGTALEHVDGGERQTPSVVTRTA